jgi:hypothetical protein
LSVISYRAATLIDCHFVGNNLRQGDRDEVAALGKTPVDSIVGGYVYGDTCMVGTVDDEPILIYGRVPVLKGPRVGAIWMLGTDKMYTYRFSVLRDSRPKLAELFHGYDMLCNHVDSRNELHIQWLRWLGFSFLRKTTAISVDGTPFYEFAKVNHV